jgi:transposase
MLTGPQTAERAGYTKPTVIKWRRQYAEVGLAGLEDVLRPGGPPTVLTDDAVCEILAAELTPAARVTPNVVPARAAVPTALLDTN